jgi:hypothetical protein
MKMNKELKNYTLELEAKTWAEKGKEFIFDKDYKFLYGLYKDRLHDCEQNESRLRFIIFMLAVVLIAMIWGAFTR